MNLQLAIWLPYWRLRMRYHRYTVEGLEHLDGPQAKLIAGLSISAPADRLDENWLQKLQTTAQEISNALGYKPPPTQRLAA